MKAEQIKALRELLDKLDSSHNDYDKEIDLAESIYWESKDLLDYYKSI